MFQGYSRQIAVMRDTRLVNADRARVNGIGEVGLDP